MPVEQLTSHVLSGGVRLAGLNFPRWAVILIGVAICAFGDVTNLDLVNF